MLMLEYNNNVTICHFFYAIIKIMSKKVANKNRNDEK